MTKRTRIIFGHISRHQTLAKIMLTINYHGLFVNYRESHEKRLPGHLKGTLPSAGKKQREMGGAGDKNTHFQVMSAVTHIQPGPTSYEHI